MKRAYASDDGKIFDSEQECLKYERELNDAKEKENRLVVQRVDFEKIKCIPRRHINNLEIEFIKSGCKS